MRLLLVWLVLVTSLDYWLGFCGVGTNGPYCCREIHRH
nr:MAG TPA: hypothetical protein [Caudoviricetes sp.]